MDKQDFISEFSRLARLNGKRVRDAKRRNEILDAQWYMTAARILKGQASPSHTRRVALLAGGR